MGQRKGHGEKTHGWLPFITAKQSHWDTKHDIPKTNSTWTCGGACSQQSAKNAHSMQAVWICTKYKAHSDLWALMTPDSPLRGSRSSHDPKQACGHPGHAIQSRPLLNIHLTCQDIFSCTMVLASRYTSSKIKGHQCHCGQPPSWDEHPMGDVCLMHDSHSHSMRGPHPFNQWHIGIDTCTTDTAGHPHLRWTPRGTNPRHKKHACQEGKRPKQE